MRWRLGAKGAKRLTEEKNESNAVQKKDIGDVCNIGVTEDFHLLLRRTHEEESGRVKKLQDTPLDSRRQTSRPGEDIRMAGGTGNYVDQTHRG